MAGFKEGANGQNTTPDFDDGAHQHKKHSIVQNDGKNDGNEHLHEIQPTVGYSAESQATVGEHKRQGDINDDCDDCTKLPKTSPKDSKYTTDVEVPEGDTNDAKNKDDDPRSLLQPSEAMQENDVTTMNGNDAASMITLEDIHREIVSLKEQNSLTLRQQDDMINHLKREVSRLRRNNENIIDTWNSNLNRILAGKVMLKRDIEWLKRRIAKNELTRERVIQFLDIIEENLESINGLEG